LFENFNLLELCHLLTDNDQMLEGKRVLVPCPDIRQAGEGVECLKIWWTYDAIKLTTYGLLLTNDLLKAGTKVDSTWGEKANEIAVHLFKFAMSVL